MSDESRNFLKVIPELVPPTLEQHRRASAAWLSRTGPCLFENWPQQLRDISFRTKSLDLTFNDREALFAAMDGKRTEALSALEVRIDAGINANFPAGAFARLSSRSPKDAWCETFRCLSGSDVIDRLAVSERILDDLVEYEYAKHPCYLLLREWCDIPKHEEWRCFIADRKIVGITQYFYTETFRAIYGDSLRDIQREIVTFLSAKIIPFLHVDTLVVDVWLRGEPLLIEINPFGLSDPCLFTYAELDGANCEMRTVP